MTACCPEELKENSDNGVFLMSMEYLNLCLGNGLDRKRYKYKFGLDGEWVDFPSAGFLAGPDAVYVRGFKHSDGKTSKQAPVKAKQAIKGGATIDYQHRKVNILETSAAGVYEHRFDKPSMLDQYRDHLSKNENVRSAMYEAGRRYMLLFEDTGLRPRAGSRMEFTDFQFGARGLENFSEKQLEAMDDFQKAQRQLTQKQRNECYDVLLLDAKVLHFKALRDGLIRLAKHWGYLNPRGKWDL